MRLSYAKQAVVEVNEALDYYNAIDSALSQRLVFEIDEALRLICAMPMAWKIIDVGGGRSVRQCRVKVFPCTLIYTFKQDVIGTVAFANTHRRPNYWRGRLV